MFLSVFVLPLGSRDAVSCWHLDSFGLTFVLCAVHLHHHVVQLLLLRHADALHTHGGAQMLLGP